MPKKVVSIATLVDMLRGAEGAPITTNRIRDLIDSVRVDERSASQFVRFGDDHYMRHLIHRDDWFDIMTICWQPGQGTPIHTHNGQLGWAVTLEGELDCTDYRYMGCDRPENQNVADMDCLSGGMQVKLDPVQELSVTPGGAMNVVHKQVTIHSLTAPADADEGTVSLHIYSKPFDSCVVFDQARGMCQRKELWFDSAPGGYKVRVRA